MEIIFSSLQIFLGINFSSSQHFLIENFLEEKVKEENFFPPKPKLLVERSDSKDRNKIVKLVLSCTPKRE